MAKKLNKKTQPLTADEIEEISGKIDTEGFDYYFTDYGAHERLKELIAPEISAYQAAKENLEMAVAALGVEF